MEVANTMLKIATIAEGTKSISSLKTSEQNLPEMLVLITNRDKVSTVSETTSNSIEVTTTSQPQIMLVALEMILEPAIKKEAPPTDANLGTTIV